MLFADIELMKKNMNECGKNSLPFLFVINYEMTEGYFIKNPTEQSNILFQVNDKGNKPSTEITNTKSKELTIYPISAQEYKSKFDIVYNGLQQGDTSLTNLTIKTPIKTNLSLSEIFLLSKSPYQILVPGRFVCFSPEPFVRITDGCISTYPMKGTINASIPNAEQIILDDYKETDEHRTVVDLLKNDLSINAKDVYVKRFRYIDRIKSQNKEILQVSSEIVGTLQDNYQSQIGDIIFSMLPAGSIAGTPKASTIEIIKNAEKEARGYYTGVFGYYDGKNLDSSVLIRFIESDGEKLFFRSGGGITIHSKWEKEYKEIVDKIYLPFV